MYSKLLTHLRGDVLVLRMEGCAPIVGFREFVGIIVKIEKVDSEDEEKEDALYIRLSLRHVPFHTTSIMILVILLLQKHTGATLLRCLSKLISNG